MASVIQLVCLRVIEMVSQCLEADTALPALYRSLRRRVPRIPSMKWEEILNVVILCAWIVFAVASFGGYVEMVPRERARKWVRTGSFSL